MTDLGWEAESLSQCRPMMPVETEISGECIARNNLEKMERDQGRVVYVFPTGRSKESGPQKPRVDFVSSECTANSSGQTG